MEKGKAGLAFSLSTFLYQLIFTSYSHITLIKSFQKVPVLTVFWYLQTATHYPHKSDGLGLSELDFTFSCQV